MKVHHGEFPIVFPLTVSALGCKDTVLIIVDYCGYYLYLIQYLGKYSDFGAKRAKGDGFVLLVLLVLRILIIFAISNTKGYSTRPLGI